MARGRRQRRSTARPALVAMLCVVGLFAAGWAVVSEIRRNPGSGKSALVPPPPATPRFEPTGIVSPAVQVCVQAVDRGEAAVSRARVALGDWDAHVQAMADQLAGRITGAQAQQVWARTRARGPGGVASFRSAQAEYQKARDRCFGLPVEQVAPAAAATVATCRDVSRQTDQVLLAGGTAVNDWAAHLAAVAAREAGRIDPHHALETWLKAYQAGRVNIAKFAAADRVYRDHARCRLPGQGDRS